MEELEVWKEKAKSAEVIISSLSDMLKAWKNRAKTAEASADYYKNLAEEKDTAMEPFVLAFLNSFTHDEFVRVVEERIVLKHKEELARAYYLDKTEGDQNE